MWNSIFRRDFFGFFNNISAYVILAVYVLLSMTTTFFIGMYLITPNHSMISFFSFQPYILALVIPAVTMRSWAEEIRNGTAESLLTFPITSLHLVLAKFFAALAIILVMLLFSIPLLVTSAFYITIDWGTIFCSYLGLIASTAILCAFGCLFSALISIPAAAYMLALLFSLLWINFNWGLIITSGFKNVPFYFERVLNFGDSYQSFLNGQISPSAIFYFVTLLCLLLFLNWLIIDNRRNRK